jgi:hypothetical protein
MNTTIKLIITPKKVLLWFTAISILFLILYYLSYPFEYQKNYLFKDYFAITKEKNVPTFFSFLIMLLISMVYFLIYKEKKKLSWLIISFFFLYLGFDDMFRIHENIGSDIGDAMVNDILKINFISYYWQVAFMPIFSLFGFYIFYITSKEFLNKKEPSAVYMMLGGFTLYIMAIALDFYEGSGSDFFWLLELLPSLYFNDIVNLMRATEEAIEMLGGTLILASLLKVKTFQINIQCHKG